METYSEVSYVMFNISVDTAVHKGLSYYREDVPCSFKNSDSKMGALLKSYFLCY